MRICGTFQSTPPARGATNNNTIAMTKLYISIHAPREGGDDVQAIIFDEFIPISIHAPREGGDCYNMCHGRYPMISIHAPREGGDRKVSSPIIGHIRFQSTPPARGATWQFCSVPQFRKNFNPRPPRGGRQCYNMCHGRYPMISIHAPREGGDSTYTGLFPFSFRFQSTPPARGATSIFFHRFMYFLFQSTPPARGATDQGGAKNVLRVISIHAPREGGDSLHGGTRPLAGISIHAPREGGDVVGVAVTLRVVIISIHAPREGGDIKSVNKVFLFITFQSTPPARGATTTSATSIRTARYFNPRPPRGGRLLFRKPASVFLHFNPRPPRGGRRKRFAVNVIAFPFQSTPPARGATISCNSSRDTAIFQSTPPARGATRFHVVLQCDVEISIHAPREGGDRSNASEGQSDNDFNPRPPRGGRRLVERCCVAFHVISIHAPREGGDLTVRQKYYNEIGISIHAPREGGDLYLDGLDHFVKISIHAPREGGDYAGIDIDAAISQFQSTPPARGATEARLAAIKQENFNPRPPRGGRR